MHIKALVSQNNGLIECHMFVIVISSIETVLKYHPFVKGIHGLETKGSRDQRRGL